MLKNLSLRKKRFKIDRKSAKNYRISFQREFRNNVLIEWKIIMTKLHSWPDSVHVCLLALIIACLPQTVIAQGKESPGAKVVATVQGVAITANELNKAAAEDLENLDLQKAQFEAQIAQNKHDALETNLRRIIQDKLFSAEAAKRGIKKEALVALEITSKLKEPTPQEIDEFWEANKGRFKESKEVMSDRIKAYLGQQNRVRITQAFVESLKKTYPVISNLKPIRYRIETKGHPARGPLNAPVTIVEFSDFQCTYCKEMAATLDRLLKEFGNKVRIIYRQYPNENNHPLAMKAAEASLCANEQGKFWEMHDLLFEDINDLATDDLKAKAEKIGLPKDAFHSCLEANRYKARIKKDYIEATRSGVSGTPALFINGRLFSGAWPYEELVSIIKEELTYKPAPASKKPSK